MLEQQQKLILSPYMAIYDIVVSKDNLLRKINELIDFGFVYDELINKYFLDMAPEEEVIDPSSLRKFRKNTSR